MNDSIEFDYDDDDDDALIVNNAPIVATDDNDEEDVIEVVQNPHSRAGVLPAINNAPVNRIATPPNYWQIHTNLFGFKQYGLKSGAIYLIQCRGSDEYGNPHPNT